MPQLGFVVQAERRSRKFNFNIAGDVSILGCIAWTIFDEQYPNHRLFSIRIAAAQIHVFIRVLLVWWLIFSFWFRDKKHEYSIMQSKVVIKDACDKYAGNNNLPNISIYEQNSRTDTHRGYRIRAQPSVVRIYEKICADRRRRRLHAGGE